MFAFALWDTVNRELFCARDPFGIKPLFMATGPGGTAVASEKKCLLDLAELIGFDTAIDERAVQHYTVLQYVPEPETLHRGVRRLESGCYAMIRPGHLEPEVTRYFVPRFAATPITRDTEQARYDEITAVLEDSVAKHMRADVTVGAFLSGGIDSAAICALAAEHKPDLLTFTVGFDRKGYSEIDLAQETAAALGLTSLPYVITAQEFFASLPRIIWHLDDPVADAAAVPLWFLAREARKHVKVVLSGEGADEIFGGYRVYSERAVVRAGEHLPDWARGPLKRTAALIPPGIRGKTLLERMATRLRHRYIGNAHVYAEPEVDAITRHDGPPAPGEYATAASITEPIFDEADQAGLDDVSAKQLVDINTWLAGDILVKADRMTMAHSLELRVPYLDREVMAVAGGLARREKIGQDTTKVALRRAVSPVLPRAVTVRAKLAFPVPIGQWLKGEAGEFAGRVLREAQTEEWIDRAAALRVLRRFREGRPEVTWRQVWVLIVFSLWHQIYVERVYDPVALGWEKHVPSA
jgi:asparagine synthase (glutamine-hydrolysing)